MSGSLRFTPRIFQHHIAAYLAGKSDSQKAAQKKTANKKAA
jgi:hypothetical protein